MVTPRYVLPLCSRQEWQDPLSRLQLPSLEKKDCQNRGRGMFILIIRDCFENPFYIASILCVDGRHRKTELTAAQVARRILQGEWHLINFVLVMGLLRGGVGRKERMKAKFLISMARFLISATSTHHFSALATANVSSRHDLCFPKFWKGSWRLSLKVKCPLSVVASSCKSIIELRLESRGGSNCASKTNE